MATRVYLRSDDAEIHRGHNNARLNGGAGPWIAYAAGEDKGIALTGRGTDTVAGATNGIEARYGPGDPSLEWITAPLSADVTISGTITANIWASESADAANVAINVVIDVVSSTAPGTGITEIVRSTRTNEVSFSGRTANNFTTGMTSGAYSGVTVHKGERLRFRVFADDSGQGNMGSGRTFNVGFSGGTDGADGDTWIEFTEAILFDVSGPGGSTLYLIDTASDLGTGGTVDREASLSPPIGSAIEASRDTVDGWTTPLQMAPTPVSMPLEWFSPPLSPFTLAGRAEASLWCHETNAAANVSFGCEVSRVDRDGANPVVWCYALLGNGGTAVGARGEVTTTSQPYQFILAGDDLPFSAGQRIRIRVFIDDLGDAPMVSGWLARFTYNAPSSTGLSFVGFDQILTEFIEGGAPYVGGGFYPTG